MAAPQNFRSAFNGFNREDVVHYIEYLNARHTSEINQLHAELDQLQAKAADVQEHTQSAEEVSRLQEENAALEALLAEQEGTIRDLKEQLETARSTPIADPQAAQLEARCAVLEQQLRDANAARILAENERDSIRTRSVEQELEAYRRAERTERVARERAEQVYRQANGALADATVKVDEAFVQIGELSDQVSQQLSLLQTAVTGSKQALAEAAATLYTIRPGTDRT